MRTRMAPGGEEGAAATTPLHQGRAAGGEPLASPRSRNSNSNTNSNNISSSRSLATNAAGQGLRVRRRCFRFSPLLALLAHPLLLLLRTRAA